MSRKFTSASSHYLEINSAALTGVPLSMACWFKQTNVTATSALISLTDKDVADQWFALVAGGSFTGDPIGAEVRAGSTFRALTTTPFTANTWHHAAAVFVGATSRFAYLDGGGAAEETSSATPTGLDRTSLGRLGDSTPSSFLDGLIAEAAIWNVALTAGEIAELAAGLKPWNIRPSALVAYWPIGGTASPEGDVIGAFPLTVTGAVASDENPPVIYAPGRPPNMGRYLDVGNGMARSDRAL